ncbi:hypothetical protein Ancab_010887 [Ancistrocladus abbreviatus]
MYTYLLPTADALTTCLVGANTTGQSVTAAQHHRSSSAAAQHHRSASAMAHEAGMFVVPQTIGHVLCPKCGILMTTNAANMCVKCLASEVDITGGLQKHRLKLKDLRLVRAEFVWTEPNSMRMVVRLRIQKEVLHGAVLEKAYEVLYVEHRQMCESCSRCQANPDQWVLFNSGSMFLTGEPFSIWSSLFLSMLLQPKPLGLSRWIMESWVKFVEFVGKVAPGRSQDDKELLPPVWEIWSTCDLHESKQQRNVVGPRCFEVNVAGSRYVLADAQVARVCDFGRNDTIFNIRTHLGHLLNPGDYAFDAILIKKNHEETCQRKRGKSRSWKLKFLNMEVDNSTRGRLEPEKMNNEYEEFLRDLEENPELRFNISLYRNKEYWPLEVASMTDGDDAPVPLEELLDELDISDDGDEAGDDGMRE